MISGERGGAAPSADPAPDLARFGSSEPSAHDVTITHVICKEPLHNKGTICK
jgi:hypothetical protein